MRNKEPQTPMGKRIRQRRKELKMTQEKLGKMIHVTANTISRWEFDGYEPELTLAVCLADALRVSLDWLVCGRLAFTAPCAVGDKVYEVIQDGGEHYICELTVTEVCSTRLFTSAYTESRGDLGTEIPYTELHKTVFLTRQAAERAVERRRV